MPVSRNRKKHKAKANARKNKIEQAKKTFQKKQREFIMNLIEQEKANGQFDNAQPLPGVDGPTLGMDGPVI